MGSWRGSKYIDTRVESTAGLPGPGHEGRCGDYSPTVTNCSIVEKKRKKMQIKLLGAIFLTFFVPDHFEKN